MSDDEKLYKDEEVITDITRRHVAGNFAARHWIEKAVRESKEYFSKQARAEVIEEVILFLANECREVHQTDEFTPWVDHYYDKISIDNYLTKLIEQK